MVAKMATMFGDVKGLQQRHQQWNIPHSVEEMKGFSLKAKSFQNTWTCQKLNGGVPSTAPPMYNGKGITLRVRPRVKKKIDVAILTRRVCLI